MRYLDGAMPRSNALNVYQGKKGGKKKKKEGKKKAVLPVH